MRRRKFKTGSYYGKDEYYLRVIWAIVSSIALAAVFIGAFLRGAL